MNVCEFDQEVFDYMFDENNWNQYHLKDECSSQFLKSELQITEIFSNRETQDLTSNSKTSQVSQEIESVSMSFPSPLTENPIIFKIEKIPEKKEGNDSTKQISNKRRSKGEMQRKFEPDGMRKKAKVYFLKYIIIRINSGIKEFVPEQQKRFIKFSKKLTETITTEYNKQLNEKTIAKIFKEDESICHKSKIFDYSHNKKLYEAVCTVEGMKDLFNRTVKEFYMEFLRADELKTHLKKLKSKESEYYIEKYIKILNDYVYYYIRKNPNKKPVKKFLK